MGKLFFSNLCIPIFILHSLPSQKVYPEKKYRTVVGSVGIGLALQLGLLLLCCLCCFHWLILSFFRKFFFVTYFCVKYLSFAISLMKRKVKYFYITIQPSQKVYFLIWFAIALTFNIFINSAEKISHPTNFSKKPKGRESFEKNSSLLVHVRVGK